ncbi:MAG: glycoside hydrolase family 2, partial [Phycisphaerales bacterium]|nr:glycoside hydrolase family 2 [Phycisphaerales bacterium]
MKRAALCVLLAAILTPAGLARADNLEQGFITPSEATKPRCYWYWLDGYITKEGITKDLEAMKRVGIGEAYIGMINTQSGLPANPDLKALSDPWWDTMVHAIREGSRIGVDIGVFNSPGWSQSGGPWVKPEQSMRYVALPEMRLHGPSRFDGKLPAPEGTFQDIAAMAFPAPESDRSDAGKQTRNSKTIDIEFPVSITARSVAIQPTKEITVTAELSVSNDGKTYRPVKEMVVDRHRLDVMVGPMTRAPIVESFPATRGRFFQLAFSGDCEVGDVVVSPAARVERFPEKQLGKVYEEPQPPFEFYSWPLRSEPNQPPLVVVPGSVANLTKQMDADGTLHWDVPAGDWVVLRAGMRPTGSRNSPAAPEATGLEIDKMNRTHVATHFNAYIGELLRRIPEGERKAWKHVVADSYERGPQNWTDGFMTDFQKRYGYDPLPYLPAMTGRVVGSVDQSDRFLWDLRRMVADRIAEDYVGGLKDICGKNGLKLWLENYGHWGFPSEFLKYGGATDEVAGEFWCGGAAGSLNSLGSVELRDASSAAHTYGKNAVFAEAFTGGPTFVNSPRDLKTRGDWAFCQGINQFTLHVYIHQPDERMPGMSAWFGSEFNRHTTWFEMSKAWFDYQRRCTHLLQHGLHVADVAYFIGEDAPKMTGLRQPALPAGYDFDYINAEVLLTRATVQNGRLTLPDGMSYRLLVLPPSQTMRPEVLAKIAKFVDQGLTVFGALPTRSPSLKNFPDSDAEIQRLAAALKDKVADGPQLQPALKVPADVSGLPPEQVLFIHRHSDDADV